MLESTKYLIIPIIISVILSIGYILSISPLIIISIIAFILSIISVKDAYKIPYLMFFLPWNGLLKLNLEGNTFFSVAALLLAIILFIKVKRINRDFTILLSTFFLFSLIVKLIHYNSFPIRYYLVFVYLFLIILIVSNQNRFLRKDEAIILFFAVGTLLANISGDILGKLPHLYDLNKDAEAQLELEIIVYRNSAFSGDPNRNSAMIAMAIAVLIITKIKPIIKYPLSALLTYYGMLTVSKMFYVLIFTIFLLFLFAKLIQKRKIITKYYYAVIFILGIVFIMQRGILDQQFVNIKNRFEQTDGLTSDTRRTSLQLDYLNYIASDITTLLIGKGFLTEFRPIDQVPHNTFIQLLFAFGLIGSIIFITLLTRIYDFASLKVYSLYDITIYLIPIFVIILAFNALDFLNMDAFYFFLLLPLITKTQIINERKRIQMKI